LLGNPLPQCSATKFLTNVRKILDPPLNVHVPNNITIVIDNNDNYDISSLMFPLLIQSIISENITIISIYRPTLLRCGQKLNDQNKLITYHQHRKVGKMVTVTKDSAITKLRTLSNMQPSCDQFPRVKCQYEHKVLFVSPRATLCKAILTGLLKFLTDNPLKTM
jgi:hypothetical protein